MILCKVTKCDSFTRSVESCEHNWMISISYNSPKTSLFTQCKYFVCDRNAIQYLNGKKITANNYSRRSKLWDTFNEWVHVCEGDFLNEHRAMFVYKTAPLQHDWMPSSKQRDAIKLKSKQRCIQAIPLQSIGATCNVFSENIIHFEAVFKTQNRSIHKIHCPYAQESPFQVVSS